MARCSIHGHQGVQGRSGDTQAGGKSREEGQTPEAAMLQRQLVEYNSQITALKRDKMLAGREENSVEAEHLEEILAYFCDQPWSRFELPRQFLLRQSSIPIIWATY